jgi:hypothetical protein
MDPWQETLDLIKAHLLAAGATLDPKLTDVRDHEPTDIRMTAPLAAYWYAGDRESETGGNTMTAVNIEEGIRIQVYWPDSVRMEAGAVERYLRAAVRAIKARLWNDASLGGHTIGLDLDGSETGWFEISGIVARSVGFTAWLDLAEVATIAP